jgi:D-beta-D-heptose 7-phosphate kinase / D-beta-D-heptose 1-phosphate adenosyltransferase
VRAALTVVGDALLDRDLDGRAERLCPDAPAPVVEDAVSRTRPGGAGLAALLAARDGHRVTLITALGRDRAGSELAAALAEAGVEVADLGLTGETPEKLRVRSGGHTLVRLDRGRRETSRPGRLTAAAQDALAGADAILVADYGYGVAAGPSLRAALAGAAGSRPLVWDPHPLGARPVRRATLVTPNRSETEQHAGHVAGAGLARVAAQGRALVEAWGAEAVCVTLSERGALLVGRTGEPVALQAPAVDGGDPCGAGDRFAACAAGRLADGATTVEAAADAVLAASAFVAAGGAAAIGRPAVEQSDPRRPVAAGAEALAARVRAEGGTVVATGGCFDLLHAGHVACLEAARALGDCLVVCLNSDESVRRLKGDGRPLVGEDDRARVLAALACVDAVAVFEEDDPTAVVRELRPHVWVKGGDYAVGGLPEAAVLADWGGVAVVVPYLTGRSTSRLIEVTRVA